MKQADILVLDMPLLDTRVKEKDITGTFVADLVLQILAYVAETERSYIHQRQAEGIRAAKDRGVRFGRPRMIKPCNYEEVYKQWREKTLSAREAGRRLNVDYTTFLRWAKETADLE